MLVKVYLMVLALHVVLIHDATGLFTDGIYESIIKENEIKNPETLEILRDVKENHKLFPAGDLKKLLILVRDNEGNCSYEYFSEIHKLEIKDLRKNTGKIVELMKKLRWNRFNECKKSLEEKIEQALVSMDPAVKTAVNQLIDFNEGPYRDPYKDLVFSLVKLMRRKEVNMTARIVDSQRNFLLSFTAEVGSVCLPYFRDLEDELDIYMLMLPDSDIEGNLDPEELAEAQVKNISNFDVLCWVLRSRMCMNIIDNLDLFSDSVRKTLKKDFKDAKRNPFLSFFGFR